MDLLNNEDFDAYIEYLDTSASPDQADYSDVLNNINNNLSEINTLLYMQEDFDDVDHLSVIESKLDVLNAVVILILALMFIQSFIRLFNKFFMFDHI